MSDLFFSAPIQNSPYERPARHWELDAEGQPTHNLIERRREASFVSPIPKPKKKTSKDQLEMVHDEGKGLSTQEQQLNNSEIINGVRAQVEEWRNISNSNAWHVTPETARLLKHWRSHPFTNIRPFFCQIEAVETAIWLTEVAPNLGKTSQFYLEHLKRTSNEANPGLDRLALKLATGAGKTTVMAMIIAWQTINAIRRPGSNKYTRGFLIVAPGITIKDRLRVLKPNDPDSYFRGRELVPEDMLPDLEKATIIITNYHAFGLRERMEVAKGTRLLLQGRGNDPITTLETEGQMIQRVMPELMGMKGVMVINDEAHHCYREKPLTEDEEALKGEEKKEAEKNSKAARLWLSGLEMVQKKMGINRVIDLSATPFFLRGSGYPEGTLFPWTMSDFSLMDAIESGIVKLPRVPVSDNIPGAEVPIFRNLWEHIRDKMPKKGRGKSDVLDPLNLPPELQTALEALYGHYKKTYDLWEKEGLKIPPCFIVVCNNTATSKIVYDFISGFYYDESEGAPQRHQKGRLELFRNFDDQGTPLSRPRTLLIDSEQLESGDALDDQFRKAAGIEIERFRKEIVERTGDSKKAENITDEELLREVMNTVGKPERLGESIRCVVSVSMLTEGWDANNVTHILGVRAFGTQLLCEQVIGRALRRQSYELNEDNRFGVEYADVLGIPFDFTAKPVVAPPQRPQEIIHVKAVRPDRDQLEITFPRVVGYRVELPKDVLRAKFDVANNFELTPDLIGPTQTKNEGIIGEGVDLNLVHTGDLRQSSLIYSLTQRLLFTKWRDEGDDPKLHLFPQLKNIVKNWLDTCLVCKGGTFPAQLMYQSLADMACERITAGISKTMEGENPIRAIIDPYNPSGSTNHVNFTTSKKNRWKTSTEKCHVNWAILDSDWEGEFCRVAEAHPKVKAYVKNQGLGLQVPYRYGSENRTYIPDFIVLVDDGHSEDFLHLIVEIKGYKKEDAKDKRITMEKYWVPGVNQLEKYGRWDFVEFSDAWQIELDFKNKIDDLFDGMIEEVTKKSN